LAFFNTRIPLQADYFNNRRHDILLKRQMVPSQNGFNENPWQNFGIVTNEGIDASFSAKTLIKDFSVGMRGNFTYARNKIVERDETPNRYEWMNSTGQPLRKNRLYVAERLLTDDDFNITTDGSGKKTYTPKAHIARSSMQPELRPGDIKYADLNNDGEIDQYDQMYGDWHPTTPEISYGVGFNFGYKNLYLNVFFQGVGNVSTVLGGNNPEGFFPFTWGIDESSLRAEALNRWTAANPSQDVLYPRLRTANNGHNQVASTWWLRDASFIRFKNLEIGYNLPKDLLKKLRLTSGRMYLMGNNLYVWDTIKMWDPEMGNANAGMKYPLQRTFTFGLDFSL
jgi:outer membrane protein